MGKSSKRVEGNAEAATGAAPGGGSGELRSGGAAGQADGAGAGEPEGAETLPEPALVAGPHKLRVPVYVAHVTAGKQYVPSLGGFAHAGDVIVSHPLLGVRVFSREELAEHFSPEGEA